GERQLRRRRRRRRRGRLAGQGRQRHADPVRQQHLYRQHPGQRGRADRQRVDRPSQVTLVDAGGTLGGTGTVGNTIINGGTLSPGNSVGTLSVQGSLALSAAATYLVEVSSSGADRTNVTGAASLGGTAQMALLPNSSLHNSYTILSAGGRNGTFGALTT